MLFTMPDGVSILHCCFVKLSFIPKKIKLSLSGKMWATVAKQTGGHWCLYIPIAQRQMKFDRLSTKFKQTKPALEQKPEK